MKKLVLIIWLGLIAVVYVALDRNKPLPKLDLSIGKCIVAKQSNGNDIIGLVIGKGKLKGVTEIMDTSHRFYVLVAPNELPKKDEEKWKKEFSQYSSPAVKNVDCNEYFK